MTRLAVVGLGPVGLATSVAFANELANICQALEVSYDEVIQGVTLDPRIESRFLVPGVGFGGSCFPKDVKAFVAAYSSLHVAIGFSLLVMYR